MPGVLSEPFVLAECPNEATPWTVGSSCCEQLRLVPVALVRSRGSACRLQAVAASIRSYHGFFEGGQEPDEVTTCFFL